MKNEMRNILTTKVLPELGYTVARELSTGNYNLMEFAITDSLGLAGNVLFQNTSKASGWYTCKLVEDTAHPFRVGKTVSYKRDYLDTL